MTNLNPYQQYQQNSVMSAGKGELTLLLYNGAVKYIKQGLKHIEEKNIEEAHNSIVRVQDILAELNGTLNMEYEISRNLALLYDYMIRRLIEANNRKDKLILDEVQGLVEDLRDTWLQVLKLSKSALASGQ